MLTTIIIFSLLLNIFLLLLTKKRNLSSTIRSSNTNKYDKEKIVDENNLLKAQNHSLKFKIEELTLSSNELEAQKKFLVTNIDKLEKLQREKTELCEMAIHDIKNPAGTIKNLVTLLDNYELTTSEQKQIHESLVNISNRIVKLVEEVATVLKKDVVTFTVNFVKKNFNNIVDLIATRYLGISKRKSIEIKKTYKVENIEAEFDPDRIEEVVENLVSNAMKFAPEGSTVELKSHIEDNHLVFEVIDNGFGLSEDEIQQAFHRGITLSTKPTAGESSSGLGLWIVKRIIDEHKGIVWVRSKKGSGSTFAFRIPLMQNRIGQ